MNINDTPDLKTFIIFICPDETFKAPENLEPEVIKWVNYTTRRGAYILGSRFRPITESKNVRVENKNVNITDLTSKDNPTRIGGFDLLKCKNIDEAVEIASKHPMAKQGSIQVRPLWDAT
jgi:hypothetical protein